jgi:tensin
LSGAIQVNSSPLFLDHVTVVGIPAFQSNGGCRAFFKVKKNKQPNPIVIFPFSPFYDFSFSFLFILPKVYQGSVPVHTSSIYNLHDSARHFTMSLGERGLALRGDILVKCYHRHRLPVDGRETIFSLQFHTCAVTQHTLVFQRQDLDDACQGPYQNKVVSLFSSLSLSFTFTAAVVCISFRSDRYRGSSSTWPTTNKNKNEMRKPTEFPPERIKPKCTYERFWSPSNDG